mgnify:CR=1 FL=1
MEPTGNLPNVQLAIVILAWNHIDDTLECLDSVLPAAGENSRIIVVDNGSTDGTADWIREAYPQVEIISSPENVGIARGYNLGIARALDLGAEYIAVMNNDVIVAPDLFRAMESAMDAAPDVGVVVPKIYHYYGSRTRLWCAGMTWRSFPPAITFIGGDQEDGPAFAQPRDLDYATSCVLLLKAEAIRQAGPFDPKYYFYFDDHDLCERFRRAGYRVRYAPDAQLWHKVSVSTQKSDKPAKWWYVMGQSTVRFFWRYKGLRVMALAAAWFTVRESLKLKFSRLPPYWAGYIQGVADHLGWVP